MKRWKNCSKSGLRLAPHHFRQQTYYCYVATAHAATLTNCFYAEMFQEMVLELAPSILRNCKRAVKRLLVFLIHHFSTLDKIIKMCLEKEAFKTSPPFSFVRLQNYGEAG